MRFSFHWVILTQDPRLALGCWPKSSPLSVEDVFESRKFCSMSVSCPSCGLLAKVKTTSCPSTLITKLSMVNGSRLTGIIKLVVPKPRLSWFKGKMLGNTLDVLAYIRYMFRAWTSPYRIYELDWIQLILEIYLVNYHTICWPKSRLCDI